MVRHVKDHGRFLCLTRSAVDLYGHCGVNFQLFDRQLRETTMIYNKRSTGATPWFNGQVRGEMPFGVKPDGGNGNSGGYVRPENFINGPNSSRVTDGIGKHFPPKGRGV
jgi:hypothetical protein